MLLPVLVRERTEVQNPFGEARESRPRTLGIAVLEVLQTVVTDHQVDRRPRAIACDRAARPAEALAEIRTELEPYVAGARKAFAQRRAQPADTATGIQDRAHGQIEIA